MLSTDKSYCKFNIKIMKAETLKPFIIAFCDFEVAQHHVSLNPFKTAIGGFRPNDLVGCLHSLRLTVDTYPDDIGVEGPYAIGQGQPLPSRCTRCRGRENAH